MKPNDVFPHINHLITDYHLDHIDFNMSCQAFSIQQESMNDKQHNAMKL